MGQFNFKNRIYAGPADGANCKPLLVEGTSAVALTPGSAALVVDGVITLVDGDNANYSGYVVKEQSSSLGGSVSKDIAIGELAEVIAPRSGDYVNVLFASGQDVQSGLLVGASDTVPGKHIVASTGVGVKAVFAADETLGVLAADTLVRCRYL